MRTEPAEFHERQFWDRFYATRGGDAFEWYGCWRDIAELVLAVAPLAEPLLVLGCGNSTLSEDMCDAGFAAVTSVDYSESVIAEMRAKTAGRSELAWEVMDVTAMRYGDASWRLVVDKGTLDALYAEETDVLGQVADSMFAEIQRVLAPGGKYALVTMAQGYVLARVLSAFSAPRWAGTVDIHPFVPGDGTARAAYLLVFTAAAAGAAALSAHVTLHGDLAAPDAPAVDAAQAGAAVARYQRLGAMADSAALSTAAPNIKALPVRHDAALFAAIGRSDDGEAGSQVGRAGSSDDSEDGSDDDGGFGAVAGGLSASTLAALADFAVDSGIVEEVDPNTLIESIMSTRGQAAVGPELDESSDETSSSEDEDEGDATGAGVAADVPAAAAPVEAKGPPAAWVTLEDPYVRRLVVEGMARRGHWACAVGASSPPEGWEREGADRPRVRFHWGEYEEVDWEAVSDGRLNTCCYCIRKGLIRKAQLAFNSQKWAAKHPDSSFVRAMPETYILQLPEKAEEGRASLEMTLKSQAPELLPQLGQTWDEGAEQDSGGKTGGASTVWIAKPSLTNGGAGVELIPTAAALLTALRANPELREWVVQRYIARPLLVDRRKFHLRVYVLCVGRLQVYVCKDVLSLFSLRVYDDASWAEREAHITNTCVQNPDSPEEERRSVQMWDEVVEQIRREQGEQAGEAAAGVFGRVCQVVGDVFAAVSPEQTTFMSLPNCFELFGFDFLLDEAFHVWFLEANAEPDFKQTGARLQGVVRTVVEATLALTADAWAAAEGGGGGGGGEAAAAAVERMVRVFAR